MMPAIVRERERPVSMTPFERPAGACGHVQAYLAHKKPPEQVDIALQLSTGERVQKSLFCGSTLLQVTFIILRQLLLPESP